MPITEEGLAWKKRWALVAQQEREELARTPVAQKVKQIATLMSAAKEFGWEEDLAAETEIVRQKWIRIRKAYSGE